MLDEGFFSIGTSFEYKKSYLSFRKYNNNGKLLEEHKLNNQPIGFGRMDYGKCLTQLNSTEWVLAYRATISDENSNYDIRLIKFNINGTVIWEKDLVGNYWDEPRQVIISNDGNIVVVGYSNWNTSVRKGYIAKVNTDDELIWEHIDDETEYLYQETAYTSVVEMKDAFYIGGKKEIEGANYAVISKINNNGAFEDEYILWDSDECFCDLTRVPYKKEIYVNTCHYESRTYIWKIFDTEKFEFRPDRGRAEPIYNRYNSIVIPDIDTDNSIVSLRSKGTFITDEGWLFQLELFKRDSLGNEFFSNTIYTDVSKINRITALDFRKTPDGGYIIAAYEESFIYIEKVG